MFSVMRFALFTKHTLIFLELLLTWSKYFANFERPVQFAFSFFKEIVHFHVL